MSISVKKVTVGDKGRITLGQIADGVSSYEIETLENGYLLLKPMIEVPALEVWLHKNPKALKSVMKGLKEAGLGEVVDAPESFAKYIDDE